MIASISIFTLNMSDLSKPTMRQLLCLTILTLAIFACNKAEKNPLKNRASSAQEQRSGLNTLKLHFNQPVSVDSSAVVMYPLTLDKNDEEDRGLGSSYSNPATYWNIVFYNTATGQSHLLDDRRKMVICSYTPSNSNAGSSPEQGSRESGHNQVDKFLYYSIIITDFNKDGRLNSDDPTYLFVSDKNGENLKQVSPTNLNVSSWQTIKATNRILLQVTKDSNGDGQFTDKDETIPMAYDLSKDRVSKEIFRDDFKKILKKTLHKHWTKEK